MEGVEGVSDDGVYCCPLGCGQCGGMGCGAIPVVNIFPDGRELPEDVTASTYCCLKAFIEIEVVCGDPGVEPPCMIPEGGSFSYVAVAEYYPKKREGKQWFEDTYLHSGLHVARFPFFVRSPPVFQDDAQFTPA